MLKAIFATFVLLALLWGGIYAFGAWRWGKLTSELLLRIEKGRSVPDQARYETRQLEGLPKSVQRYFRTVLTHDQPMIAAATVSHQGTFDLGDGDARWKAFTSRQRVIAHKPGFVWDGRIVIPARVHDAFALGEGLLHASILGVFDVADMQDSSAVAEGELMRFLAEAAWYPTALLPSQGVVWEPIDDQSATATLKVGHVKANLVFHFGADGLIQSVRTEARGRMVKGKMTPTPWEGRWSNYQQHDGLLIPMSGEVAWILPEGDKPYWRGTITSLKFEFMP
jgi:hypothetical protein